MACFRSRKDGQILGLEMLSIALGGTQSMHEAGTSLGPCCSRQAYARLSRNSRAGTS